MPQRISNDANIYAFKREKDNNLVIGIINFSDTPEQLHLTDPAVFGTHRDYFTREEILLSADPLLLDPWEFMVMADTD